jgi:streptogramin lyase
VGLTESADPGASLAEAIDSGGNLWTIGSGAPLLEKTSQVGTLQLSVSPGTGGLNLPAAIAIDGDSRVWVANGNGSVSEFSNAGAALSPSNGFADPSLSTPSGVAVDLAGSAWITNKGNNSVTRIMGGAAPTAPIATEDANKTTGSKP